MGSGGIGCCEVYLTPTRVNTLTTLSVRKLTGNRHNVNMGTL